MADRTFSPLILVQQHLQPNSPPAITSLTANPMSVQVGGQSTISVVASDPDGNPLTYDWSAICGMLSSTTGPEDKTWTAPSTLGTCTISVTVTNPLDARATASVDIRVVPTPTSNRPPAITSFAANPMAVHVSEQSTILVIASDPDGDPLTYNWSATCGTLSGTTGAQDKTWSAPTTVPLSGLCTVAITVTDPSGASASARVDIQVLPPPVRNSPPTITSLIANPLSVPVGGQSTSSVQASDPDGDPLTYNWSATCGTLSGQTGPGDKTWTAPTDQLETRSPQDSFLRFIRGFRLQQLRMALRYLRFLLQMCLQGIWISRLTSPPSVLHRSVLLEVAAHKN